MKLDPKKMIPFLKITQFCVIASQFSIVCCIICVLVIEKNNNKSTCGEITTEMWTDD